MTETTDTRADTTRQQILRAAARQFARLPYHQVGLDDVLAEAELTKGAMYFHFRSKHALALAVIDDQTTKSTEAVADLLARKFSGLETLIDFSYQLAVRDISDDICRAALHLLESIGRIEDLQATSLKAWTDTLAQTVQRAIAELPVEFREIVVLREMEGFSYKEIAELSDVPIGTVMSRLARARKLLQKSLAGEFQPGGAK